ncbi:fatty acid-binding protein 2, liver-like [Ciona intestinalis]
MEFAGTWMLKEQVGYEEFMKLMGVPEQYITAGKNAPVSLKVECSDGENFTVTTTTGPKSWTDTFKVGEPTTICGPGQRPIKTVVHLVDGKLTGEYEIGGANLRAYRQLVGDKLHDILSTEGITFKRIFDRQ